MANEAVMATNDDASQCKRYAVHKGYWKDNYLQHFVKSLPERKTPEINRGYYIRHITVYHVIQQFLSETQRKCQIVTLGAGFDTLFWLLQEGGNLPIHGLYEVDLKQVVQKKCYYIQSSPVLRKLVTNCKIDIQNAFLSSDLYHLMAVDITNIVELQSGLSKLGVQYDVPTLFVAECLFVYLPHENTQEILNFVSNEFKAAMVVDYDPVNLNDRFGEVMKQNLRGRQCNLVGAHSDLISKKAMYSCFDFVHIKLFYDIYINLPKVEKQRIEKIEFLDEIDLLYDLLKHYCLCVAYKRNEKYDFSAMAF